MGTTSRLTLKAESLEALRERIDKVSVRTRPMRLVTPAHANAKIVVEYRNFPIRVWTLDGITKYDTAYEVKNG